MASSESSATEVVAAPATTTTKSAEPDRDVAVEALNHLVQGKRHLLVQDISSAVNSLAEACRLLDACYGQMADECGDAYYNYGVALLELSRRGPGLLTNGKDGSGSEQEDGANDDDDDDDDEDGDDENEDDDKDDDDDDEEEKEEGSDSDKTNDKSLDADQVACKIENVNAVPNLGVAEIKAKSGDSDAKSENLEESEAADERKEDKPLDEPSAASGDKNSEATPLVTTSVPTASSSATDTAKTELAVPAEEQKAGTSSGVEKSGEDEEPSNLQLAWEVLEVAKIIFKRQLGKNPDVMPHLARVHSKLGEVSMESENYQQSIDDLLECLAMQKSCLAADDRCIAETYYHLGLAYSFDLQFEASIANFNNAIQVLKDRTVNFEKNVVSNVDSKTEEKESVQKEIDELKVLISDILEKIADTDDLRKNTVKLPEALNDNPVIPSPKKEKPESQNEVDSTTPSLNTAKPAFNINHLVRKKRKNEEGEVSTSEANVAEAKRPRADIDEHVIDDSAAQPDNSTSTNGEVTMEDNVGTSINGTADSITTST